MTSFQEQIVNVIKDAGGATPREIVDKICSCYTYDRKIGGAINANLTRLAKSGVLCSPTDNHGFYGKWTVAS